MSVCRIRSQRWPMICQIHALDIRTMFQASSRRPRSTVRVVRAETSTVSFAHTGGDEIFNATAIEETTFLADASHIAL